MNNIYLSDLSGGVNTAESKTQLGLTTKKLFWYDSLNVEIYNNKGIARQNGNIREFAIGQNGVVLSGDEPDSLAPSILSLCEYPSTSSKIMLFSTSDGKVFYYNFATESAICLKSGLYANKAVNFVKFLDGVICSNGCDDLLFIDLNSDEQVKSCDAKDSSDIPIRGSVIASFKSRLWVADGAKLYFSALGSYTDWSTADDAGYIANFHVDTAEIVAMKPYKEYLAIYKADKVYLLSGSSPEDFAVVPFADKGAGSLQGVVSVDNRQFFFSDGVYTLSQVGELAQIVMSSDIALNIKENLKNTDKTRFSEVIALAYERKNQIWFFVPGQNEQYLRFVWIYDYLNKAWFKREMPQNVTAAGVIGGRIYTATAQGELFLEDESDLFNGAPISFMWKSPFLSFGKPDLRKSVDEFMIIFDEDFDNNFNFSVSKNFNEYQNSDPEVITTVDNWAILWDDDNCNWADSTSSAILGTYWANNIECCRKVEISEENYSIQLVITGNTSAQNFAIIGFCFNDIYFDG